MKNVCDPAFRIVAFVLAVFVVLLPACNRGSKGDAAGTATHETAARSVHVEEMAGQDVTLTFEDSGSLEAISDVRVSAQVSGPVVEVLKDLGERCEAGEVVLRIDPETYRLTAEQARAALVAAKASYDYNESEQGRMKTLYKNGDLSKSAFDKFELQFRQSESEFYRAQATRDLAEKNLKDAQVSCPFAGVIAERLVGLGQMVSIGTPLFNLVDLSEVKLTLGASEHDIASIQPGAPAFVTVDALPGRTFAGKVRQVGSKAIGLSRAFPVEVRITNEDGQLRAGMVARVTIEKEQRKAALLIPFDLIQFDAEGATARVFIARNGKASEKILRLGPKTGARVIVEEGLAPGDLLIVTGARGLAEGSPVRIEKEPVN